METRLTHRLAEYLPTQPIGNSEVSLADVVDYWLVASRSAMLIFAASGSLLFASSFLAKSKVGVIALTVTSAGAAVGMGLAESAESKSRLARRSLAQPGMSGIEPMVKPGVSQREAPALTPLTLPSLESSGFDFETFDWEAVRDYNRHPHMICIGKTGDGKTYSIEQIMKWLGGEAMVITPKRKASQWQGMTVVGAPRKFADIDHAIKLQFREMESRIERLDEQHPTRLVALDELTTIKNECPDAIARITGLIREARETGIRLFLAAQGRQMKLLGLDGQSDLYDNLLEILVGEFALTRANQLVRRKLITLDAHEWLKSQKYPMLVNDKPAQLPV